MTPQKWTTILLSTLVIFTSQVSGAQTSGRTVKRNIATVLFASLGGAVLGLSTLSFYGEPQEHTNNITLGALVGFVAGVGYVVYDSSRPVPSGHEEFSQVFDQDQKTRRALAFQTKAPPLFLISYDF